MTLYNKPILKTYSMFIDNRYLELVITDDIDYFNIHILDEKYRDDELNTLLLQEPKDCVSIEDLDDIFCQSQIIEHYLWDKNYGYKGKMYSFSISIADESEL